ncbi:hypothetical protein TRIUR3_31760 [Triticum urartu]|uniref:Uncharacterized protein n=1 Tax=Triticum urartu TaxID=4572 RepID=M7Z0J7_TRIUA|nr:hypothetical protein TRIUR3_31760 [Triticum urartu]
MARGRGGCARGHRRGKRQPKDTRPSAPSRARARRGPRVEELGLLHDLGGGGGGWQRVEAEGTWIGGAATDWMGMDPEVGDECGGGRRDKSP